MIFRQLLEPVAVASGIWGLLNRRVRAGAVLEASADDGNLIDFVHSVLQVIHGNGVGRLYRREAHFAALLSDEPL